MDKTQEKPINPARLLREFGRMARYARPRLDQTFSGEDIDLLIKDARREYGALIPQLPDIGGKQPFTRFIIYTAMWLAIYRAMEARGKSVEEAGELFFRISQTILEAYPAFIVRMFGRNIFSHHYQQELQKRAVESQQRQYPDDYVYAYIPGDGVSFDYGVDYLECGGCKFLAKQGALHLARYVCPVDILYSELFGWGLSRTMTLAEGSAKCDFRFKKGAPTRVKVPAALEAVTAEMLAH